MANIVDTNIQQIKLTFKWKSLYIQIWAKIKVRSLYLSECATLKYEIWNYTQNIIFGFHTPFNTVCGWIWNLAF